MTGIDLICVDPQAAKAPKESPARRGKRVKVKKKRAKSKSPQAKPNPRKIPVEVEEEEGASHKPSGVERGQIIFDDDEKVTEL